jgi:hypothetical protein
LKGNVARGFGYARRGLSLKAENGQLKNLLSQVDDNASGSNDVIRDEGIE